MRVHALYIDHNTCTRSKKILLWSPKDQEQLTQVFGAGVMIIAVVSTKFKSVCFVVDEGKSDSWSNYSAHNSRYLCSSVHFAH